MKKYLSLFLVFFSLAQIYAQFVDVSVESNITEVQPMTGIVLWTTSSAVNTDAVSLEYSYMLYDDIVSEEGVYDWSSVETLLDAVAARGHQAILRFRYVYVGYETSVPAYIKALSDYHETEGTSEGETTWFPDWSHQALKDFTLDFYTNLAQKYDDDPRLAFLQTGFGLWAEYHIYDGPFTLGGTFPSKAFQTTFLQHLDYVFEHTSWSVSIDAADGDYSPFENNPSLKNLSFGNFDDSFMCQQHPYENEINWNFFGLEHYNTNPAGGEFSYYTAWDQQHVLDFPEGSHGISYEDFAKKFHISYIIGNDQPDYQSMDRIKQASMASGYKFWVKSFKVAADSAIVEVKNIGVASFYFDAYLAVNGARSTETLRFMIPGETRTFHIAAGGSEPELTIECDRLVDGQHIDYFGTTYEPLGTLELAQKEFDVAVYPTLLEAGKPITIDIKESFAKPASLSIYSESGQLMDTMPLSINNNTYPTNRLDRGVYFLTISAQHYRSKSIRIVVD